MISEMFGGGGWVGEGGDERHDPQAPAIHFMPTRSPTFTLDASAPGPGGVSFLLMLWWFEWWWYTKLDDFAYAFVSTDLAGLGWVWEDGPA